jgi:hypothetical protein
MIPNRMVSYIRCLFPCTYVFLIFPTVWLLYVLFISIYIRIPHIPNRMAFKYAVHFHVNTYSSYSQPYGFYICCSFPCTYVFLIFQTVWLLYTLFISTYIRIPHIPNRTRLFADGGSSLRRCGTAEICGIAMQAEDTADSILLQKRGARMAFMCQRTKV